MNRRHLGARLGWAATVLGLSAAVVFIPADDCTASMSGGCVQAGDRLLTPRGSIGERLATGPGEVTVISVLASREIQENFTEGGPTPAPPGSVFVLVEYSARTNDASFATSARLVHGDVTYTPAHNVGSPPRPQPGFVDKGNLGFLVPRSVLDEDLEVMVGFFVGKAARVPIPNLSVQDAPLVPGEA